MTVKPTRRAQSRKKRRLAPLPGPEINRLIDRLARAASRREAARLRRQLIEGWYGKPIARLRREERALRLARRVFENETGARRWMTRPQFGLGGRVPAQLCATAAGAKEVETLLRRIDLDVLG